MTLILVMVTAQSPQHPLTPPSAVIGLSTGGDTTARLEMPSTGELSCLVACPFLVTTYYAKTPRSWTDGLQPSRQANDERAQEMTDI